VSAPDPAIPSGATQQYQAVGIYSDGSKKDLSSTVVWSSQDPAVAAVTATGGLATAQAPGDAVLQASLDGINGTAALTVTWTARDPGTPQILYGVTWGSGQFVAVGGGGAIVTSPDGITWTPRSSGTPNTLRGVAWGNGQFVVVGGSGTILTSPDGVAWTPRPSGTGRNLDAVAWSGSRFMAVGLSPPLQGGIYPGTILGSLDGAAWSSPTGNGSLFDLYGVAWGPGQFTAVGGGAAAEPGVLASTGFLAESPDGQAWNNLPLLAPAASQGLLRAAAWSGTRLVVVGDYTKATTTAILTSPDGQAWSPAPVPVQDGNPVASDLYGVGWTGTQFTTVGDAGTILGSADGLAWTAYVSGTSSPLYAVASSGERSVAVGGALVFGVPQGVVVTDR
jgi:hypothetical protein